ncbi:MAG: HD domain-containing protein [Prevotella sp.]|nr:HD domain-containing protein [Prevotella sp.]
MTQEEYQNYLQQYDAQINEIRQQAHDLHQSVNQTYGDNLPYGFHLDMVAEGVRDYGHLICASEADVLPLFFGAYFHDCIEDARQSYHDVLGRAKKLFDDDHALMAAEIVYALTNDKGRTRAERAGERYYEGIRTTPYAPFVKLCDRLANVTYSCSIDGGKFDRMREVYKNEMGEFLMSISTESDDPRLKLPEEVIIALAEVLIEERYQEEALEEWKNR